MKKSFFIIFALTISLVTKAEARPVAFKGEEYLKAKAILEKK